jgi:hypothetical protein
MTSILCAHINQKAWLIKYLPMSEQLYVIVVMCAFVYLTEFTHSTWQVLHTFRYVYVCMCYNYSVFLLMVCINCDSQVSLRSTYHPLSLSLTVFRCWRHFLPLFIPPSPLSSSPSCLNFSPVSVLRTPPSDTWLPAALQRWLRSSCTQQCR